MTLEATGLPGRLLATLLFVFLNGFFVATEFALVKVRAARIANLVHLGHKRARLVQHMLDHMTLYLSSCQLGVTLSSLILGWLAEPAVAVGLVWLAGQAGLALSPGVTHVVSLALALTIVTILHMTIGEQAPKIWALHRAEKTALFVAWPLRVFTWLFRPLIVVINWLANRMLRLVGLDPDSSEETPPDATELLALVQHSAEAGHITPRQEEFTRNVLEIAGLEVRHLLVPRAEVVCLTIEDDLQVSLDRLRESRHTRFPLCRTDLDSIVGVVHAKQVLAQLLEGDVTTLEPLSRPAIYVPDTLPVSRLLRKLQNARSGCAVVTEEHGTVVGMVFLEDVLERIVGPIQDEFDRPEDEPARIREVKPGVWEVDGEVPLPEISAVLSLRDLGDEDTFGGYVTDALHDLPAVGAELTVHEYRIRVLEVGGHRVRRLRVEALASPDGDDEG